MGRTAFAMLPPTTNWVKQCDACTMCRPLESTAVRLATNRQGTSLDSCHRDLLVDRATALAPVVVYKPHELGDASVMSWKGLAVGKC
jgi:hypothetical protein